MLRFLRASAANIAILAAATAWFCSSMAASLQAAPPQRGKATGSVKPSAPARQLLHTYHSKRLAMHTDLDAAAARRMLAELETDLARMADYWGKPLAGVLDCQIVGDLKAWPAGTLPEVAREKVARRAGITLTETITLNGRPVSATAVLYAPDEPRVARHELVHAYCGQTWGATGPLWYAEGMAEMGDGWRRPSPVVCQEVVARFLRSAAPVAAVRVAQAGSDRSAPRETADWRTYARRWALCHLLMHNPNYSARFHRLGLAYLAGQAADFKTEFSSQLPELEFEYDYFLKHVTTGYRADLCAWNWRHPSKPLAAGAALDCRVEAARGWQPSGVSVAAGQRYRYSATGE